MLFFKRLHKNYLEAKCTSRVECLICYRFATVVRAQILTERSKEKMRHRRRREEEKKRKIIQIIIPPLNVVQFHERATSYLHLRPFNFPIYWSIHFVHTFCHRRRRCSYSIRDMCRYEKANQSGEFATRHANVVTLFCARPRQIMPSGFSEKIAFCASANFVGSDISLNPFLWFPDIFRMDGYLRLVIVCRHPLRAARTKGLTLTESLNGLSWWSSWYEQRRWKNANETFPALSGSQNPYKLSEIDLNSDDGSSQRRMP